MYIVLTLSTHYIILKRRRRYERREVVMKLSLQPLCWTTEREELFLIRDKNIDTRTQTSVHCLHTDIDSNCFPVASLKHMDCKRYICNEKAQNKTGLKLQYYTLLLWVGGLECISIPTFFLLKDHHFENIMHLWRTHKACFYKYV